MAITARHPEVSTELVEVFIKACPEPAEGGMRVIFLGMTVKQYPCGKLYRPLVKLHSVLVIDPSPIECD